MDGRGWHGLGGPSWNRGKPARLARPACSGLWHREATTAVTRRARTAALAGNTVALYYRDTIMS